MSPEREEQTRQESSFISDPSRATAFALLGLFILALIFTLRVAKPVLLPVTLAVILNFVFKPIQRHLSRIGLNRIASAAAIMGVLGGLVIWGAVNLLEPASTWMEKMPVQLSQMEYKIRDLMEPVQRMRELAERVGQLTQMDQQPPAQEVEVQGQRISEEVWQTFRGFMVYLALTSILLFFILAYGEHFYRKLITESETFKFVQKLSGDISSYLLTITLINCGLGICMAGAMFAIGLPNAMLWGAMAFVLNFVPYLGAMIGTIIIFLVAILTFDSTAHVLLVPVVYFTVTAIEGNFVTPMILGRRFIINPIIIFSWLILWAWIWGVIGALIAVPLLMAFRIICEHVKSLEIVGRLMSHK